MKKIILSVSVFVLTFVFSGCGGGGSDSSSGNATETKSGVFLDSAVKGLTYKTVSKSGKTDAEGKFNYKNGEKVLFSLGGIQLGSATGSEILTPLEVLNAENIDDPKVIKLLKFLQSVDSDNNASNGITISQDVLDNANSMDTNLTDELNTTALLNQLGVLNSSIVSETQAKAHFQTTLRQRDSASGTLIDGLILHMPFTSNAQNISSTDIEIEEKNVTISDFTLNMINNDMNTSYIPALEPRNITISFWAKLDASSTDQDELLFALHDGKVNYLADIGNTTTKYGIKKLTQNGVPTMALYMRLPLIEGGEYHTSYYIQNLDTILESNTWHHFTFTYSPDIDVANGYKGIARVFYDGNSNMSFIHKTTVSEIDYFVTSDMNDTAYKSYSTPTFSFGKFNGGIDDLRIYNRVLSHDEVLELSKVRK